MITPLLLGSSLLMAAPPDHPPAPRQELRGIWVTRWSWESPEDLQQMVREVSEAGFNTLFFQVRGQFDAHYPSAFEPWAAARLGEGGEAPSWDPLELVIQEADKRSLEVHAWVNTFTLWRGEEAPPDTVPPHPLLEHPDWRLHNQQGQPMPPTDPYLFASPGHPEVRSWIASVLQDLDLRYQLDGIHLDYLRYPRSEYAYDQGQFPGGDHDAWRREQVLLTVQAVAERVQVPLSAAVWGIYQNRWGWEGVSEGYQHYHQDSGAMMQRGLLDAMVPMVYWPVSDPPGQRLDFRTLAQDHLQRGYSGEVWLGMEAKHGLEEALRCVEVVRQEGAAGWVLFDYSQARPWLQDFGRRANGTSSPAP